MPTPDEELDLLLRALEDPLPTAAVPPVPDFSQPAPAAAQPSAADAEINALLAQPDEPEAAPEDRIGHGDSMPVQLIEAQPDAAGEAYTRGLKSEVKPQGWFSSLLPKQRAAGDFDPEQVAEYNKYMQSISTVPGVAKNFAAATAMNFAGAPVGHAKQAGLGALQALTARAADDPNATTGDIAGSGLVGGLVGAGASMFGEGLAGAAQNAKKSANEYLTQVFMTPAQRAGYKAAKGPDALAKLGAQAEDAGMFKPRSWVDRLLPVNARRVAENAEKVRATAGPAIGQFEDQYVQGSTAEVPVGDIASGLRGKAADIGKMIDTDSPADARVMSQLADRIDQPATAPVTGEFTEFPELREAPPLRGAPPPLPPRPEPEQLTFVPDRTPRPAMVRSEPVQQSLPLQPEPEQLVMSLDPGPQMSLSVPQTKPPGNQFTPPAPVPEQLGFGPQQLSLAEVPPRPAPKPEPWTPGELSGQQMDFGMAAVQKTPLETTATITRDSMPLQEAIANKRNLADRIDWSKKRADQTTYGQEAARKYAWGELSDRITNALQDEVTRGKIPASAMAQYKKNMQDFSTAATVYDPALKTAERHGQVGLGLTDLLTASAVGGGPIGGLAALSTKATRGMAPAVAARFNKMLAGMAEFGAPAAAGAARVAPQLTAIEQAQQDAPEGTPKHEIVDAANRQLKSQIHGLEPLLPRNQ